MKGHSAFRSVRVCILTMGLLSGFVVPVDHAIAGHTAGNPPSFLFKWGSLCQLFDVLGGSGTLQGCVDPDGTGPLELGDGQFQQPGGLTLDSQGNVYVMDLGNHRIQKFDGKGSFLRKWGSFCDINDEFHRGMPTGCADADGDGPLQLGDGQFFLNFLGGAGIAIDSTDNVYVVDQGNNRIQVFDSNGTFLRKWGSKCPSRVEPCDGFLGPRGMAIDGGDFVYVYDGGRAFSDERQPIIDRVQKFDRNGTRVLKFQFCGPYTGNTCHGPNFITALNGWALAADSNDNVYVLRQFSSVAKFDSNGNRIGYFNPFTGFATPDAIAVDSLGQVYVRGIQSDSRVVRVVRDTGLLTPEFLFQFAQGSGAGDLQGDGGIALHPQSENVYLSDNTYLPNVTSPEIKVWGVTPLDGIESIIERVEDLVDLGELTQGQANALIVKLEAAIQQLQMDSSHVAVNQLQAFINHVNDLINTGVLPPSEGQPLIDAANHVIEVLNAGQ